MTPTHPLTPSENAEVNTALQQACAAMDAERLNCLVNLSNKENHKRRSVFRLSVNNKYFASRAKDYIESATAYHLAAALLAGQIAERL